MKKKKPHRVEIDGIIYVPASTDTIKTNDDRDAALAAVKHILTAIYLYSNYEVGTRGPRGQLYDAIRALSPDIAAMLVDEDADDVYKRLFSDEEE